MNPTFYWMVPFVVFAVFLFILGLWTTHGIRKETAAKRAAGFAVSSQESRAGTEYE
ncbi:MAG: hypothetical protein QOF63_1423 [Thermoanaerobaculia bacterium]|nr:hypothetical protein [Thermoanaerobaculia bacterium]